MPSPTPSGAAAPPTRPQPHPLACCEPPVCQPQGLPLLGMVFLHLPQNGSSDFGQEIPINNIPLRDLFRFSTLLFQIKPHLSCDPSCILSSSWVQFTATPTTHAPVECEAQESRVSCAFSLLCHHDCRKVVPARWYGSNPVLNYSSWAVQSSCLSTWESIGCFCLFCFHSKLDSMSTKSLVFWRIAHRL